MFKILVGLRRSCCSSVKSRIENRANCISRIWFGPLPKDSQWIKPGRLHYLENDVEKQVDIIKTMNGVVVLLYNKSREKLIFVRQLRGAVYQGIYSAGSSEMSKGEANLEKFPPEIGVTLELCGGAVDKDKSLAEIAKEEVLEECGYEVTTESLKHVYDYRSGIGTSSSAMTLYYCEVCDDQKVSEGGGVDTEKIQVLEMSVEESRKLVQTGAITNGGPSCLMGLLWFFLNKAPNLST
ncbi:uridine diphosphate glucose pyrophosphatase NUDT14 [Drosophila takahashii]|uniref:uridine diphosphate glucose pyrophosphatase NUDT14 n=1 Tax=Drosophila takahashii TaxID=29030 RepID=UPI001CF87749|nr:uridine diphosphate glucose pyrophosphatase NUDT14 [Drosophila takahashii]